MRLRGRPEHWVGAGLVAVMLGVAGFQLLDQADPAHAVGAVDIDGYPARTEVTACAEPLVGKPGVVAFRSLVLSQLGGGDDGLQVCKLIANDSGSLSDHADGRAWDWHVEAKRATDRARVDRLLNWLLRPDERGHRNAMARRIGITYIIWNHQYYRVSSDDARWVPYTSTGDPHDTHVHFSFSVAGAAQETSWWADRAPLTWLVPGAREVPLTFGQGPDQPVVGDWDGDGRDTMGVFDPVGRRFSLRNGISAGPADLITPPIGPFGAVPLVGDWDGDGRDELGVYDSVQRRFSFTSLTGAQLRSSLVLGAAGDVPVVGDWNGDGTDDIGIFTSGTQTFSLRQQDGSVTERRLGETHDAPVIGDWDGDRVDDLGMYNATTRMFALRAADGSLRQQFLGGFRDTPVVGDWNGSGRDAPATVSAGRRP